MTTGGRERSKGREGWEEEIKEEEGDRGVDERG